LRADDRGDGVFMDAVGLVDRDVDEAGRGERALELRARERSGDATRPVRRVGPCRVVHVAVAQHDGPAASAPQPDRAASAIAVAAAA
jgi:hypothetical protein